LVLGLDSDKLESGWCIEDQRRQLFEKRASVGAQIDFIYDDGYFGYLGGV
jgi:hypothetical protein